MSRLLRAPVVVRGDVEGLLCRGMPMRWRDEDARWTATTGKLPHPESDDYFVLIAPSDTPMLGLVADPGDVAIDFSDRAAIYLSLAWLSDRGHDVLWMLPRTHGGRVDAWDGLTAWEVSAILVSVSVERVAKGGEPLDGFVSVRVQKVSFEATPTRDAKDFWNVLFVVEPVWDGKNRDMVFDTEDAQQAALEKVLGVLRSGPVVLAILTSGGVEVPDALR